MNQFTFILLLPEWHSDQEYSCQCRRHVRHRFSLWVRKILWRRKWQPTPVFLMKNPMDRGASWTTVCWVAKSQTRLSTHTHTLILHHSLRSLCLTFHIGRIEVGAVLEGLLQSGTLTRMKVQCHSIQFKAAKLKLHLSSPVSSMNGIDKPHCAERSRKNDKRTAVWTT